MAVVAVVRIRGYAGAPWYINDTLDMLRMPKKFNAMVYPLTQSLEGMLRVVEPYVTWGELNEEGASALVERLKVKGGRGLDGQVLKLLNVSSKEELVKAIVEGKLELHKYDDVLSLPIRLHPPKGGFKGKVNRPYKMKGEFGYRGLEINKLIVRMS